MTFARRPGPLGRFNRRGLGSGGGWAPTKIASLVAWWDASYGITKDGSDLVSAWAARYGSYDLVQVTGTKQPKWLATSGQSGGPVVWFRRAGNTERMTCAALVTTQPFTVVTLYKQLALQAFQRIYDSASGVANDRAIIYTPATTTIINQFAGTADVASTVPLAANTWFRFCAVFNGASSVFRVNDTENTGAPGAGDWSSVGMTLGNQAVGNNAANGYIQHHLVFNAALGATDRALIAAWMSRQ